MKSKQTMLESLKYIEENLEKPLSLADISSYIGYSEYHFSRMFKSSNGIAVMDYVKKRKLIKASSDILNGDKIIDVALHYGWQSHTGFTKAFKQEFGFSPALLRGMLLQMDFLQGGNTMNYIFMKKTDEHATKEQLFIILKQEISRAGIAVDMQKLDQIYDFACLSYQNKKRYSGDDYVTHTLNIAILLVQMGADENTIFTGLLCDVMSKTDITEENISNVVSIEVASKLVKLKDFNVKLQIADSEDIIMVKLAERLHNMRTIKFMDEELKAVKAKETIELFMPIARKLGNDKLVAELNDLSLKYVVS